MASRPDPTNGEIAEVLVELGDRYELDGANVHRVLAYRRAADTIRDTPRSVAAMVRAGTVTDLDGVGTTLEEKLVALLDTGGIPVLEKLRAKIPEGLLRITKLPGLGPKKARRLHAELGIDGPDALRRAIEERRVRALSGFGARTEERLLEALDRADAAAADGHDGAERVLLPRAREIGDALVAELRDATGIDPDRIALAGSARRWAETVHDLDVVAGADDPAAVVAAFAASDLIARVDRSGEHGASGVTHSGLGVDLRVVPPDRFGNLLQHFTGSRAHNVAIREAAVKRGLRVSEHGILDEATGVTHRFADEADVYAHLGLTWVDPELREHRGELELEEAPRLIEPGDLRGDLHMHTVASDGRATVEQMATAARDRGLEYVAITDHSASHGFGDAVSAEQLRTLIAEVRDVDARLDGITVLAGSEVNIGTDGGLDYDDDLLAELDWVVASVHTAFDRDPTARIVAACEHPSVDVVGHPTGRLIGSRAPYAVDVEAVIAAAARTGTFLEINGSPRRRDLHEVHARAARDAGVLLCIDSDAHRPDTLANTRWGIATARRAWLGPDDVANARPWDELRRLRKGGR
ncbi:MAG: DNA polymerase/3'-5' exonuclease PolX [Solirubrobacteraceae bacterium]|nr:DNA polymerase/3'-5' exonuclease PolX [Solirubrobacteraceae bacterium]